ncbi:MAG: glycolate oxidase subunit GlcE [Rhodospirillales bacterium]|nr:glycolate oxidase subunit GlcE [Rhodospirillales bacterium]
MAETFKPETVNHIVEATQWAAANGMALDICGHGTKRGLGKPVQADAVLDLSGLSGITLYEPEELVMSARAGTPMAEIEAALQEANQMLAFEPWSPQFLYGQTGGTIGGVLACNGSGPRRMQVGAARDHMLGFNAVGGGGEVFKSGGRVVKNVTGFDLTKLMAGAMGTLGVLTDVSFKVLPRPEKARTVLLFGAVDVSQALIKAQCSEHELSACAHLPQVLAMRSSVDFVKNAGASVTAVRIEGPAPSLAVRCAALRELLAPLGAGVDELHTVNTETLWAEIRDVQYFDATKQIWRISVAPSEGPAIAVGLADRLGGEYVLDWAGGLIWLAVDPADDAHVNSVRGALASGHATLMRATQAVRRHVPVFQPQTDALTALTARVRENYDPAGIFNPGRMV